MKILFVCWANVGRSQMAAACYNKFTKTQNATSAGTAVEVPGETLGQRRERRGGTHVIDIMRDEEGIDLATSPQTQLTQGMLMDYDYIISMAQPEYTPAWLSNDPKYIYWDIEDPGGKDYAKTREAKADVRDHVIRFLAEHDV